MSRLVLIGRNRDQFKCRRHKIGHSSREGERIIQRERGSLGIKNPATTSAGSGIGIVNVSRHTLSNFFCHKSFAKNFSFAGFAKIFLDVRIGRNWGQFKCCRHKIGHSSREGERSGIDSSTPLLFCQLKVGK